MAESMNIVILGLSVTSSWGNGHATVWRSLMRGLSRRGHRVLFLERDMPWYAANRDLPAPPFGRTILYGDLAQLEREYAAAVRKADAVVVGSFVPQGAAVGDWVQQTARGATAFYDIDTPITLAKLATGDESYLTPSQIPQYDLYLSFTGGPTLGVLERDHEAKRAEALYCCVDPELYYPESAAARWDMGYMGTYSDDRQPSLDELMLSVAGRWGDGRFIVAGPQYPQDVTWPGNVERIEHLPPGEHRRFYNEQRFALNITRQAMRQAGHAPSVRLFEAAACGTAIITDEWPGLETFFEVGREILVARKSADTLHYLRSLSEDQRNTIGLRARRKVLNRHTASHRAAELERYLCQAKGTPPRQRRPLLALGARRADRASAETDPSPLDDNPRDDAPAEGPPMLGDQIEALGPWFHNLHLPGGAQTAPQHFLGDFPRYKWLEISDHLPGNMDGLEVLDIGCNAGFYSIELARRGARVLGIDHDPRYLAQARWAARQFEIEDRLELRQMQAYDLARLDRRFDLVLFMGVFYHLRYPLLVLDMVAQKVKRLLVFQTLTMPGMEVERETDNHGFDERETMLEPGWPRMAFIEHRFANDPTNWWAPNHAAVEAMLRSTGLRVIGRPGHEIYLCQPTIAGDAASARSWDQAELLAATGLSRRG